MAVQAKTAQRGGNGNFSNNSNTDPRQGALVGIAAYADSLHEPSKFDENAPGKPKYQVSLIFPNAPMIAAAREMLGRAIKAVVDKKYPDSRSLPARGLRGVKREPLIKSVSEYPTMWPECPNPEAIFVRMSSTEAPFLADENGDRYSPEMARMMLKSGVIVRALFGAYHYETGGDPGISLGLNAVQYLRPGVRMGRYVDTGALKSEVNDYLYEGLDI